MSLALNQFELSLMEFHSSNNMVGLNPVTMLHNFRNKLIKHMAVIRNYIDFHINNFTYL